MPDEGLVESESAGEHARGGDEDAHEPNVAVPAVPQVSLAVDVAILVRRFPDHLVGGSGGQRVFAHHRLEVTQHLGENRVPNDGAQLQIPNGGYDQD